MFSFQIRVQTTSLSAEKLQRRLKKKGQCSGFLPVFSAAISAHTSSHQQLNKVNLQLIKATCGGRRIPWLSSRLRSRCFFNNLSLCSPKTERLFCFSSPLHLMSLFYFLYNAQSTSRNQNQLFAPTSDPTGQRQVQKNHVDPVSSGFITPTQRLLFKLTLWPDYFLCSDLSVPTSTTWPVSLYLHLH